MSSNPKNIKEAARDLSKLESFDSKAFLQSDKTSQVLCDLILSLALFSNDLKDIILFNVIASEYMPKDDDLITQEAGQYNGVMQHIERMYASKVYELRELLSKNPEIYSSEEFRGILRLLPERNRNCWNDLVSTLTEKNDQPNNEFINILGNIRSNISYHYTSQIKDGYRSFFIDKKNEPFVSRGNKVGEFRFYFIDAAAQEYFKQSIESRKQSDYGTNIKAVMENILFSIYLLVEKFLNTQSSFKEPVTKKFSEINQ